MGAVVDHLFDRLDKGVQKHVAVKIDDGHAGERAFVAFNADHFAVEGDVLAGTERGWRSANRGHDHEG